MLEHVITYEDFNGDTVTDRLFFNLTKSELIKLQTSVPGGMQQVLSDLVEAKDVGALIREFDKILLAAYGVRSEDGKRFIKSQQLREEFESSAAYDEMFSRIASDEKFAADFVVGVFPKDLGLAEALAQPAPKLPPPAVQELPSI
jgi:hypothetical protein